MRNYDENPIIINDYGALFLAGWYIILYSILVFVFAFSDYELLYRIYLIALPASFLLFCLYNTYVFAPRVFKQKPSFFRFSSEQIYHIEYVYVNKVESKEKIALVKDVEKVYFCVISELDRRYGRLHFFTPYQLYKKSSIGVHFNKTKDFIRYLLVYLIFALPFKIYKLKKSGEPLWLLRKNFVIRMKNRNYFLVIAIAEMIILSCCGIFGQTKSQWRTRRNLCRKLKGLRYFSRTNTRFGATIQTIRKYQKTTGDVR